MGAKLSHDVLELLVKLSNDPSYVTQHCIEVLLSDPARAFTTVTGAGVSQDIVEVLIRVPSLPMRISQDVIEVLCVPTEIIPSGGSSSGGTRGFSYIS